MSDLSSLIARVEAATGPDRELDVLIDCAIRFPALRPARSDDHKEFQRGYPPSKGDIWCPTGFIMAQSYTSSIDAALTLLPEGAGYNLQGAGDVHYAVSAGHYSKKCPTPALALLSAILKARESSHEA